VVGAPWIAALVEWAAALWLTSALWLESTLRVLAALPPGVAPMVFAASAASVALAEFVVVN
jgi:hypothetical protein